VPGTQCNYGNNLCLCLPQGWRCIPLPFGDAGACPPTRPTNGTVCTTPNLLCPYGTNRACICIFGQWQCGGPDGG
jgi:hypothetical protein